MARLFKVSVTFLGSLLLMFLFNASVSKTPKPTIDEEAMITFILQEYDYEVTYGYENVDPEIFVDQLMLETLRKNK